MERKQGPRLACLGQTITCAFCNVSAIVRDHACERTSQVAAVGNGSSERAKPEVYRLGVRANERREDTSMVRSVCRWREQDGPRVVSTTLAAAIPSQPSSSVWPGPRSGNHHDQHGEQTKPLLPLCSFARIARRGADDAGQEAPSSEQSSQAFASPANCLCSFARFARSTAGVMPKVGPTLRPNEQCHRGSRGFVRSLALPAGRNRADANHRASPDHTMRSFLRS